MSTDRQEATQPWLLFNRGGGAQEGNILALTVINFFDKE